MKTLMPSLDPARRNQIEMVTIVIVGLGIRLLLLGRKSLWLDEAFGLQVVEAGQKALWAGQAGLYHPPLYSLLLEWWTRFGQGEFYLRLLSVVPATAAIPVFYLLAKDWFGRQVAASAAALMAVSPLLVWYAQESRPYSLLGFLSLLSVLCASRFFQGGKMVWLLLLILAMTAADYLHYFAVFLIPLEMVLFFYLRANKRSTWRAGLYWGLGIAVVLLAWLPWLQSPAFQGFWRINVSEQNHFLNLVAQRTGLSYGLQAGLILSLVVGSPIIAAAFFFYGPTRRLLSERTLSAVREDRWVRAGAAAFFVVQLLLVLLPRGYSLKRHLVQFWPYLLLLFAWFFPYERRGSRQASFLLAASFAAAILNVVAIPKPQWREASDYIVLRQQQGDVVLLEPSYMTIPFDYYNRGMSNRQGVRFGLDEEALNKFMEENRRIWLLLHTGDGDPQQRTAGWLDEHTQFIESKRFYRLEIRLYESRVVAWRPQGAARPVRANSHRSTG